MLERSKNSGGPDKNYSHEYVIYCIRNLNHIVSEILLYIYITDNNLNHIVLV